MRKEILEKACFLPLGRYGCLNESISHVFGNHTLMAQEQDVLVWQLVQASDFFLKKAHKLSSKALQDTSGRILDKYNTLIKASLNCLFKILRHYTAILDARIQSILYYKTAQILFKETISSDLAQDYCIKGIQICKRNEPNLTSTKLKLQFLNFQIQFQCNSSSNLKKQALAYLNSVLHKEIPEDTSYLNIRVFFSFTKFQHFRSIYTPERNVADLTRMYNQIENKLSKENYLFLQFILINLIELQLQNTTMITEVRGNLVKLRSYQESDNSFGVKTPAPFEAIAILFDVLLSINEFQCDKSIEIIQQVNTFFKTFKQSTQKSWPSKLIFNFHLENDSSSFPVEFSLLSLKDFSFISYLYCGILCSFKSWEKNNKSVKIFKLASSSLITDTKSTSFCFEEVQVRKIRQDYFKVITSAYQLLSDFVKDKFPAFDHNNSESITNLLCNYNELLEFIKSYENDEYSAYECAAFDNLIPLVHYIFGLIYQRNGCFQKALCHYSKARFSCSKSNAKVNSLSAAAYLRSDHETFNDPIYADFIQSNMGVLGSYSQPLGTGNEIYVLSTLNILSIISYLLEEEKRKQKDLSEFDIGYDLHLKRLLNFLKLKDSLSLQINQILQTINSTSCGPNSSSTIPQITISALCYFYTTKDHKFISTLNLEETSKLSPLLASFLYLIMGYTYKVDPGLTELENLNIRVGFYASACKYSAKACSSANVNAIAQLGYLEIWKIMNHNKNMYTAESIDHVYEKFQYFANTTCRNSDESSENNDSGKRVKFV